MYVVRMGDRKGAHKVWWEDLRERDHFKDLKNVDGWVILKLIFRSEMGRHGLNRSDSG